MSKEIVRAGIKYNNKLYDGFDHGECFRKLNEDNTIIINSKIEQGFVDNDGNFVDRKQAMIIAKEAGQLRYEPNKKTLISEDLYLDWLNKQNQQITELEERINWLVEAEFNRKWAKKYVEMRRKEDPMLCLPDSDEVYEKYFELKQQLEEKEKKIQDLMLCEFVATTLDFNKLSADNCRLREQLADKEKELKRIKKNWKLSKGQQKRLYDSLKLRCKDALEQIDQDKISFAVEKLEKVLVLIHNAVNINSPEYDLVGLYDAVSNQIKEIKGE